MIGLVAMGIISLIALMVLRSKSVRWRFAIPFSVLPGVFCLLTLYGIVVGAIICGAYYKIDLPD